MDHLCMSHSVFLLTTDQLLQSPLTVPKVPLLSHLISLLVKKLPQMQEPFLTFSAMPGEQVLSYFLSSSSLLSFILLS